MHVMRRSLVRALVVAVAGLALMAVVVTLVWKRSNPTVPGPRGADQADEDAQSLRTPAEREVLRKQVIHLVLIDRYFGEHSSNTDFTNLLEFHGGNIRGVAAKLDYLKSLGINTVWLTPVYKQVHDLPTGHRSGKAPYHGYWPDWTDPDDGAVDPHFGTAEDLKQLIAGLHKANMRFVMDMIVNHAGYDATISKQHPNWFHPDPPKDSKDIVTAPLAGLPDFSQEDEAVSAYLTKQSLRWVQNFELDGIRMDTAKHVPLPYFKEEWIPAVRRTRPKLFLVAEVMNDKKGEYASVTSLKKFLDAGFDSAFNFWLRDALVASVGRGGSLDLVAAVVGDTWRDLGKDRALLLCNLLDNHDTPRFTSEPNVWTGPTHLSTQAIGCQTLASAGVPAGALSHCIAAVGLMQSAVLSVPEEEILRRYHVALVLLFTLPGIPQLYYGDEIGMYGGPDPKNRRSMPRDWPWTTDGRNRPRAERDPGIPRFCLPEPDLTFRWIRKLIALRGANAALHSGSIAELCRPHSGQNAYAFIRSFQGNHIVVVMNESDEQLGPIALALQHNEDIRPEDKEALKDGAVLTRLLGQDSCPEMLQVDHGKLTVTMPARCVGVYRLRE
ncbi:MAG: alpha-amylase family glycosyl hydrolase [Isosphaerales bacterium]